MSPAQAASLSHGALDAEQHDDHCRVSTDGQNWWIRAARWPRLALVNENGETVVDLSHMDWRVYHEAWREMQRERFGVDLV